jgi:hypothetical protein
MNRGFASTGRHASPLVSRRRSDSKTSSEAFKTLRRNFAVHAATSCVRGVAVANQHADVSFVFVAVSWPTNIWTSRSCSRRCVTNEHLGVSFVLFRVGPIECRMAAEYDRATRSTLAFSGERGKRGAFAAGFKWGAIGVSRHAAVLHFRAFKPHLPPVCRNLDLHPRFPRVAGACSGGQRHWERGRDRRRGTGGPQRERAD